MFVAKCPGKLRETFIFNFYYLLVIFSPLRFIRKKVGIWPKMPENVEISMVSAFSKSGQKPGIGWAFGHIFCPNLPLFGSWPNIKWVWPL
jgi:hypothetical protein